MAILSVDIGGSAVKYGVLKDRDLLENNQFPTPVTRQKFYAEILQILKNFKHKYTIKGLGISCPGEVDELTGMIGGLSFVPFLHLGEFQKECSREVGLPVTMINDANSAALAEITLGIGVDYSNSIYLIIGSGLGLGIVENKQIQFNSFEKINEVEKLVANGIKDWNNSKVSPVRIGRRVSLKKFQPPNTIEGKDVFEMAKAGDTIAIREVDKMYRSLAEVILCLDSAFSPELIGIGGGISSNPDLLPTVNEYIKRIYNETSGIATIFRTVFHKDMAKAPDLPNLKICCFQSNANLLGAGLHFQSIYPTT